MGSHCHISVSFACDDYENLAPLARKHLGPLLEKSKRIRAKPSRLGDDFEFGPEDHAIDFLRDLSDRRGALCGPKGGVCTWGETGKSVQEERFVRELAPFWQDVLSGVDGLPCRHEHIVVFYEHEDSSPGAFEVYVPSGGDPHACGGEPDDPADQKGELLEDLPEGIRIYRHDNLPFRWNQA